MKKIFMMLALSLPLMAQEVEVKEIDGKTEVTVKKQRMSDMREWKQRGDMKRGDMTKKRMAMANRKKMHKKRAIRSAVRILVVGGVAYYIGYHQGQHNKHGMKRKPYMGDRK